MLTSHQSLTRAALFALLLGSSAIALPAFAANGSKDMPQSSTAMASADTTTETTTTTHTKMEKKDPADMMEKHVEVRIKTLHDEIGVTQDQEESWQNVAQVMRDNESSIAQLVEARKANAEEMTAIDDMKSYQAIAQAHADGVTKFLDVFEPFYNDTLTDAQKSKANNFFGTFEMHTPPVKHHKHHVVTKKTTTSTTTGAQ